MPKTNMSAARVADLLGNIQMQKIVACDRIFMKRTLSPLEKSAAAAKLTEELEALRVATKMFQALAKSQARESMEETESKAIALAKEIGV